MTAGLRTAANRPETAGDAALVRAYRAGPDRLRTALRGMTADQLSARARGPNRWSASEIALHLVDSELMGAARVRFALAQPGCVFAVYDQDAWSAELGRRTASPSQLVEAVELFEKLRQATTRIVTARADAWDRAGTHPEAGVLSVRALVRLYVEHTEAHLEQISECRRLLGLSVELPAFSW